MKAVENKGFGIIGIRVELSFIELLLIRKQLSTITEGGFLNMQCEMPDKVALLNIIRFCEKLMYSNLGEDMKKAGEELFSAPRIEAPMPLMPDEDLKNECALNGLENESPER